MPVRECEGGPALAGVEEWGGGCGLGAMAGCELDLGGFFCVRIK